MDCIYCGFELDLCILFVVHLKLVEFVNIMDKKNIVFHVSCFGFKVKVVLL